MPRLRMIAFAVGLTCLMGCWSADALGKDTKIVLIAGKKSHAPGEHEYERGLNLLRHCLDTSLNARHMIVEFYGNDWPEDERVLDDAATIVIFSDGGSSGQQHPLVAGNHMPVLEKQMVTKHGWYEAPPNAVTDRWVFHNDFELLFRASLPILVTDVNGDGLADLMAGNGHGYGLYWFEQQRDAQGRRTFVRHAIEEHYANFHTMTLADLNGDGQPDLVTGKRLFGHDGRDEGEFDPLFLFWYDIQGGKFERHVISFNHLQYLPGRENVHEPPQYAPGTGMRITVGDLNGDGQPDLVLGGRGGLYAFLHRGLTPIPKSMNPQVPLMGEKQP